MSETCEYSLYLSETCEHSLYLSETSELVQMFDLVTDSRIPGILNKLFSKNKGSG